MIPDIASRGANIVSFRSSRPQRRDLGVLCRHAHKLDKRIIAMDGLVTRVSGSMARKRRAEHIFRAVEALRIHIAIRNSPIDAGTIFESAPDLLCIRESDHWACVVLRSSVGK
jgi:hypothetical protein